jgi:hypothetical protein
MTSETEALYVKFDHTQRFNPNAMQQDVRKSIEVCQGVVHTRVTDA